MSWTGRTNARCLNNYITALSRYQSIKPIRGSDNLRPLAERRKQHLNIRMVGDDVVVRLYHTDIITYKQDGTIILNNGGHASKTTHEAITSISPFIVCGHGDQTWVRSRFIDLNGLECNGVLPLRDNTPEEFKRIDIEEHGHFSYGEWHRVTPLFPVVHIVNRKAANRVRDRYKSFWDYSMGALKLLGEDGRFSRETFKDALGYYHTFMLRNADIQTLMLSENAGDQFKALLSLLSPGGEHTEKAFRAAFQAMTLKLHADEVLEAKTVTTGEFVTDKYRGYNRHHLT